MLDTLDSRLVALFCMVQKASLDVPPPADAPVDDAPDDAPADPPVGPNAIWQARIPSTVRRPCPSDAPDGPGPREHREVFIRLKYELCEFLAPHADGDALDAELWEACEHDRPLQALLCLAAGANSTMSRPAPDAPDAAPDAAAPIEVSDTPVAASGADSGQPAAADAADAADAEAAAAGARVTLLDHARACGSALCIELLLLHGAAPPPPSPVPELAPEPPHAEGGPEPSSPAARALAPLLSGGEASPPAAAEALLEEAIGAVSELTAGISETLGGASSTAAATASSAAASAGAAFARFRSSAATSTAASFLSGVAGDAVAATKAVAARGAMTGLYTTYEDDGTASSPGRRGMSTAVEGGEVGDDSGRKPPPAPGGDM